MNSRVVITGLGGITPLGRNMVEAWAHLLQGRSGVRKITRFDASEFPVRIAGEAPEPNLDSASGNLPELSGESDPKVLLGWDAATQAWADSSLPASALNPSLLSVGVSLEVFFIKPVIPVATAPNIGAALAARVLKSNNLEPLQTPLSRLADLLGDCFGFKSGRYTNCSACAAGAQAVGEAFHLVREGAAAAALAGATDSAINPLGLGGFSLLRILSTENDTPESACRPFDATRQGTVLSEGAVFLVLENLTHAMARGARIYAEIIGFGTSFDAFRVTDPDPNGRGAVLSMRRALADAALAPDQIDGVNAHGTGTPKNDIAETRALKEVLAARASLVPVTANKSMTGHMIAASGAFEAAASALTLFHRKMTPTINLLHPDPECDLDYVSDGVRPFTGRSILSNSFGFGGQNASLILARWPN